MPYNCRFKKILTSDGRGNTSDCLGKKANKYFFVEETTFNCCFNIFGKNVSYNQFIFQIRDKLGWELGPRHLLLLGGRGERGDIGGGRPDKGGLRGLQGEEGKIKNIIFMGNMYMLLVCSCK